MRKGGERWRKERAGKEVMKRKKKREKCGRRMEKREREKMRKCRIEGRD